MAPRRNANDPRVESDQDEAHLLILCVDTISPLARSPPLELAFVRPRRPICWLLIASRGARLSTQLEKHFDNGNKRPKEISIRLLCALAAKSGCKQERNSPAESVLPSVGRNTITAHDCRGAMAEIEQILGRSCTRCLHLCNFRLVATPLLFSRSFPYFQLGPRILPTFRLLESSTKFKSAACVCV